MRSIIRMIATATVLSLATAAPAAAQLAVNRSPVEAPVLGTTIRGVSPTVFRISPGGGVTRVSGDAIRLSTASVRTPTVTIHCGVNRVESLCAFRYIRVRITPAPGSGPARITRLRIGALDDGRVVGGAPSEGAALDFLIAPLGLFGNASFELGMDVTLTGGAPSGEHDFDYLVTVLLQ